MNKLQLFTVASMDELSWPQANTEPSLESPALDFINDFRRSEPVTTDSQATADEVYSFMLHTHIHTVCVLNADSHFIGVIHLDDLSDQAFIRKQAEGLKRSEIKVTDLMLHRRDLLAFDADEIRRAKIGEVLQTMKEHGKRSCLVLDRGSHRILGILSVSEISRRLGAPIEIPPPGEFYRVFAPAGLAHW